MGTSLRRAATAAAWCSDAESGRNTAVRFGAPGMTAPAWFLVTCRVAPLSNFEVRRGRNADPSRGSPPQPTPTPAKEVRSRAPAAHWRELLFGRRLRTEEEQDEQLGAWSGVPVLGLDALASASYGPEAALTVLLPLGTAAAAGAMPWVVVAVLGVLLLVFLSYRQTIAAYPTGGGSFAVAKENLGRFAGVLAGSALALDYVLNVAVAISAGVGALISAVPELQPHTLALCLAVLALLVATNLRGIRTAGLVFVTPTYAFVFLLGATIAVGLVKALLAGGRPVPIDPAPQLPALGAGVGLWLLVHAFASGCTALTGVEAVSNAVPLFRPPAVRRARLTLTLLVLMLALLVAGVGALARFYGIGATAPGEAGYESVLSQLVGAVAGRGPWYCATMASVLAVLALSANTSFADFPRVCRLLALDEFLPAGFAHRGGRLVYTLGIVVLALCAGLLLVAFDGVTDRLIPLFAVGAFLAFTLSQAGMLAHWHRQGWRKHLRPLLLNGLGTFATAVTLIVIAVAKFCEGAWLTLVVLPLLLALFYAIRRHHERIERQTAAEGPLDLSRLREPLVVVPVKRLDRVARRALQCALSMSPQVQVVQVLAEELRTEDLTALWAEWVERPARAAGVRPPQLVRISSEYREFFGPFLAYLRRLSSEEPERTIAVVVPELAERRWYQFLLRHRATLLKGLLVLQGHARIVVISTPYYLRE